MSTRTMLTGANRRLILLVLLAICASWGTAQRSHAAERKFLVMLANSPKEHGAAQVPPGEPPLENPADVYQAYFGPGSSFANYWKEISYGDVTVTGDVTDWIELPWPIQPKGSTPSDAEDLNDLQDILFSYGKPERFDNSQGMVRIDIDGDPNGEDNGPFANEFPEGSYDTTANGGFDVWRPGGRFLDIDGDDRWDGLDEARNAMDFDGDGRADLLGPWLDLDGSGTPNNTGNCIYLPDSDNDGNPDCCPNGPGQTGCAGFPVDSPMGQPDTACPGTTWTDARGAAVRDCNGNLIPDTCDVAGGCERDDCRETDWYQRNASRCTQLAQKSADRLPGVDEEGSCSDGEPDGIPDECQFEEGRTGELCCNSPTDSCTPAVRATTPRCEFHDVNGNNQLDVVEPFESFVRTIYGRSLDPTDPTPIFPPPMNPNAPKTLGEKNEKYIRDNYPGDADSIIAMSTGRVIFGSHDPLLKGLGGCKCPSGDACEVAVLGTCEANPSRFCRYPDIGDCEGAGDCLPVENTVTLLFCPDLDRRHIQFTPPDRWFEPGDETAPPTTTKMWIPPRGDIRENEEFSCVAEAPLTLPVMKSTPRPSWLATAWKDRYCGEDNPDCCPHDNCVPAWNSTINHWERYDAQLRRFFKANRGGLTGEGVGWTGGGANTQLQFVTCIFDEDSFGQARILPEEQGGVGSKLQQFDGWVEYDDLPSSKYHRGGDLALGEVTSPFNTEIYGEDLYPVLGGGDGQIRAAGPLALSSNGTLDNDAGNLLNMEVLTWRTEAPFNTGDYWEWQQVWVHGNAGFHPYAGPLGGQGENLGFRDYNLDGLIDQGEVRPQGSENYLVDSFIELGRIPGTETQYPFNRQRILEDLVEALDPIVDFDDYIDTVSLNQIECSQGKPADLVPTAYPIYDETGFVNPPRLIEPVGVVSGIVLLSRDSHGSGDFLRAPSYYPIHNEDADPSSDYSFPDRTGSRTNWNLFFHDLVIEMNDARAANAYQVAYSAHEYLHTWEGWPDLYDYDIYKDEPGVVINTPIGRWDIMAGSGRVPIALVHSIPPLKESFCTRWIDPVDLTTVLTPGVDTTVTLPRSEFVRDDSYLFFENPSRPGERFYFWSVGSGFDVNMPASGMLILHTDIGSNPEALPFLTQNGTRFNYVIVQADGLGDLEAGNPPYGDAGDPWPGSTNKRVFDCSTNPASRWYTLNACSGLEVRNVSLDGNGSASVIFNWQPTNIPSLSFIDPPGGTSVNKQYQVRFRAADVYGGTTIRLYFSQDVDDFTQSAANRIGDVVKSTPGFVNLSRQWNITGLADGQYFIFAHLVPGIGSDGIEEPYTTPRAGRNNEGNGSLVVDHAYVSDKVVNGEARSQTWKAECTSTDGSTWLISSTVTQIEPDEGVTPPAGYIATTGQPYTSTDDSVRFTIQAGSTPFTVGDIFVFTTTGVTAMSAPVNIVGGRISENPIAVIKASPLTPKSGEAVSFDGRDSFNPDGRDLQYQWNFGDGTSATGSTVQHVYTGARTYTAVLRVTDAVSGRFGESSVDIILPNNSPKAVIRATPSSGKLPLVVSFSGTESSDAESPNNRLIYTWQFGDGTSVGTGIPGELSTVSHTYTTQGDFTASLTVTDEGGKSNTATVKILAGNSRPVAVITTTALNGTDNHEVTFNAINSFDPDGDAFTILWNFGDGQTAGPYPPTGPAGTTNGNVTHLFKIPSGQTSAVFKVTATLTDARGASTSWPGVDVRLSQAATGTSTPFAIFTLDPDPPVAGEQFTADASLSFDRPGGGPPASYEWSFGDGSTATGRVAAHTYAAAGVYQIMLTVADAETPPNKASTTRTVTVAGSGQPPPGANQPPKAALTVNPSRGPVGTAFTFDGSGSADPEGAALTYRWVFGDGATGRGVRVEHAYDTPGFYQVRLTVRDNKNASDDAVTTVEVTGEQGNQDPVAIIGSGKRSGAAPLRLTFNGENSYDPDGDSLTYAWTITQNDAIVANLSGAVVTYTFTQVGDYELSLTVEDGNGGSNTRGPILIEVSLAPTVNDNTNTNDNQNENGGTGRPVRPSGICGIGMLPALFVSLLGLAGFAARRRTPLGGR
ncbi:MAG: PKD domain-containing protein [Phycisphaerae bacterium]|nr:PKD domain-containing protein [Phycisphaerae bacterium]